MPSIIVSLYELHTATASDWADLGSFLKQASKLSQARSLQSLDRLASARFRYRGERFRLRGLLRVGFGIELYAHWHNSTNLPTVDADGQRMNAGIQALVAASV